MAMTILALLLVSFLRGLAYAQDNPQEESVYLLTFYTGSWFLGGTDANLVIRLQGTAGDSGLMWFHPGGHQFEVGGVDTFTVNKDYGAVTRVLISHDNSGGNPSWHFDKLVIRDVLRDQTLTYTCNCWVPHDVSTPSHVFTENLDDCLSRPCLNNATCVDDLNAFRCDCPAGWTGLRCESDVDECVETGRFENGSSWCQNGGMCRNKIGTEAYCECLDGFTGSRCESNIDECELHSEICLNNGTCVDTAPGHYCECPRGYSGLHCEQDIDECLLFMPCENNATCTNTNGSYICNCLEGWTGWNCSFDIDECAINSIPNNSLCSDEGNSTTCLFDALCLNNGTCVNIIGSHKCICPSGFTGANCENDVNECLISEPLCANGGRCSNHFGGWHCNCTSGFRGERCEADVNECYSGEDVCHGGACVNTHGGFTCICPPGFTGSRCERDLRPCSSRPCFNGGTCHNYANLTDFHCSCPSGFLGENCEAEANKCASDPCASGSTCIASTNDYRCICPPGATGTNCNSDMIVESTTSTSPTTFERITSTPLHGAGRKDVDVFSDDKVSQKKQSEENPDENNTGVKRVGNGEVDASTESIGEGIITTTRSQDRSTSTRADVEVVVDVSGCSRSCGHLVENLLYVGITLIVYFL